MARLPSREANRSRMTRMRTVVTSFAESSMGALTIEAGSVIGDAGRARDSTTRLFCRYAAGIAMCASISVLTPRAESQQLPHTGSKTMTELDTVDVPLRSTARTKTENDSIRPFRFRASDEELADLRRRILATRLPEK